VKRSQGSAGTVEIEYVTREGTAVNEFDYDHVSGVLTFSPGELEKTLTINLKETTRYD